MNVQWLKKLFSRSSHVRRYRARQRSAVVEVLESRALLAFTPATQFAVSGRPVSVAVADLNGDGRPDLVTANAESNNVSILLGNGAGGFTKATGSPIAVGYWPISVAVADLNGDGRPDLVTANSSSGNVSVLLGNGVGGFTASAGSPVAVGDSPSSVAAADLNSDGHLDVVTANYDNDNVSVLLGNGAGGLAVATGSPVAAGYGPSSVALADLNSDGRPDLVTANTWSDNVSVLLGDGAGSFTAATGSPVATGAGPKSVAVADLNSDGRLDIVTANAYDRSVGVLLGNGAGGFNAAAGGSVDPAFIPTCVAVADIDSDGRLDVVTANRSTSVSVLLGDGAGGLTPEPGSPLDEGDPTSVALADINGDGRPDLVVANFYSSNVIVRLNEQAPVLMLSGSLDYVPGGPSLIVAPAATLTDADSPDFAEGVLRVRIAITKGPHNVLAIGGGLTVDGAGNVLQGSTIIGSRTSDGVGTNELKVTFNANATPAMVQALIRSITFSNLGGSIGQRQVIFSVSDGDGGTSTDQVVLVDINSLPEPPVIAAFGDALTFTEGSAPVLVAPSATVSDADSNNFGGGFLSARIRVNAGSHDRLTIQNIGGVSTSGRLVLFGGVTIGSFTGGSGDLPLRITLNAAATAARVQAVLRALAFQNLSQAPSTATRQLAVFINDGGNTSATHTKSIQVIAVNDAPVLSGIGGTVGYVRGSAAIILAGSATVTDVDSFDFGGGKLRVRFLNSPDMGEANRLVIGGGFTVGLQNNVRQDGKIIGRLNANGGVGTTELIVTFNTAATRSVVQALTRSIKFKTIEGVAGQRRVHSSLYDGDGGQSAELTKTVNVT